MNNSVIVKMYTITPVHIGNGNTLSPYSDYIFDEDNGTIYIIDEEKVERTLSNMKNGDKVIDEFVKRLMVKKSSNDSYPLKKFFNDYHIDFKNVTRFNIKTTANIKNEQIQEHIKSGDRLYIPGSSLKGAIRTALLYVHRRDSRYSVMDALGVADDAKRGKKKTSNGGDVFGEFGNDVLKYLHISDTNPLSPEEKEVVKTHRYDLKNSKISIPITKEVIPAHKEFTFRLQCKAKKGYDRLDKQFSYLYKSDNQQGERAILTKVNIFFKQLIEQELKLLKQLNDPNLLQVVKLYENLYEKAKQFNQEKNGTVLRLGSGKTFYDNTITSLFSSQDFDQFRKKMKLGNYKPFPKTRTVMENGNTWDTVLGWVYLYLE